MADGYAGECEPVAHEAYQARIEAALEKSLREGTKRSSWTAPNAEYEQTVRSFAREALSLGGNGFLSSFLPFVQRVARLGVQNSLAQTVMKLTSPGVPDIYQGCELWDLSLSTRTIAAPSTIVCART